MFIILKSTPKRSAFFHILCQAINNISFSHTEDNIKLYLNAADLAFKEIRKAIDKDSVEGILTDGARVNPIFKRNIK